MTTTPASPGEAAYLGRFLDTPNALAFAALPSTTQDLWHRVAAYVLSATPVTPGMIAAGVRELACSPIGEEARSAGGRTLVKAIVRAAMRAHGGACLQPSGHLAELIASLRDQAQAEDKARRDRVGVHYCEQFRPSSVELSASWQAAEALGLRTFRRSRRGLTRPTPVNRMGTWVFVRLFTPSLTLTCRSASSASSAAGACSASRPCCWPGASPSRPI